MKTLKEQTDAKRYKHLGRPKEPLLAIMDGEVGRKLTEKELEEIDNTRMEAIRRRRKRERTERNRGSAIRRNMRRTERRR